MDYNIFKHHLNNPTEHNLLSDSQMSELLIECEEHQLPDIRTLS